MIRQERCSLSVASGSALSVPAAQSAATASSGLPMGRYIEEILQPGEKVLYSTNEHWMFFLPAIAAGLMVVVFLVLWRLVTNDALMLVCLALAAMTGLAALYQLAGGP